MHHTLCQQYLNAIYQDSGTVKYEAATIAETSGTILYESVQKLLHVMQLTENDVFTDYGSGNGNIVAQVFLNSLVKEAIGIEIVEACHQQAIYIADRIQKELPHFYNNNRKLTFINSDFLKAPINTTSVAFVSALCFPPQLLHQLGTLINNLPNIRMVLSLRPIKTLQRLHFKKTIHLQGSWDSVLCYWYSILDK